MKKAIFLAVSAALLVLAGCQKSEIDGACTEGEAPVFTASIDGGTKTTVNVSSGKVRWEAKDEITVTGSLNSSVYAVKSIDADGKATFARKSGEPSPGSGPYTAVYGTAPAASQTYSTSAGKLYMTAPATNGTELQFTVACGLVKLNLNKVGEFVKSVAVTCTAPGGAQQTYTLACPSVGITTANDFYIAVPAGICTRIKIANYDNKLCILNANPGVQVMDNHIKPITLTAGQINFNILPGTFSVSASKAVHFSAGNLWYDKSSSSFKFELNQYSHDSDIKGTHKSYFLWSKSASVACASNYSDGSAATGDVLFTNDPDDATAANPDFTAGGMTGAWRTLSLDEWKYLFENHSYTVGAEVCGAKCVVIAPDECLNGYSFNNSKTSYSVADWAVAEAAGVACMPYAGHVNSSPNLVNDGTYMYVWASDCDSKSNGNHVFYQNTKIQFGANSRSYGKSVRLVLDD